MSITAAFRLPSAFALRERLFFRVLFAHARRHSRCQSRACGKVETAPSAIRIDCFFSRIKHLAVTGIPLGEKNFSITAMPSFILHIGFAPPMYRQRSRMRSLLSLYNKGDK